MLLVLCVFIFVIPSIVYFLVQKVLERFSIGDCEDKIVVVSGADSGFGNNLALKLRSKGFIVFALCKTKDGMENILAANTTIYTYLVDISSPDSVDSFVQHFDDYVTHNRNHTFWALVNNAGIMGTCVPDDLSSLSNYYEVFAVNFFGTIDITQKLKKYLKKSKGRIITMTSCVVNTVLPYAGPYNSSKAAVESYIDTLRLELYEFGVTCVTLQPSCYKTCMLNSGTINHKIDLAWASLNDSARLYYTEEKISEFKEEYNDFLWRNASSNIDDVTACYMIALTSRFPKPKYQVGFKSIAILTPISFLPTRVSDFIVKMFAMKPLEVILHSTTKPVTN